MYFSPIPCANDDNDAVYPDLELLASNSTLTRVTSVAHLRLVNKPMALGEIFYQYRVVVHGFVSHYRVSSTVYALLTGDSIRRMRREQYPRIPKAEQKKKED